MQLVDKLFGLISHDVGIDLGTLHRNAILCRRLMQPFHTSVTVGGRDYLEMLCRS